MAWCGSLPFYYRWLKLQPTWGRVEVEVEEVEGTEEIQTRCGATDGHVAVNCTAVVQSNAADVFGTATMSDPANTITDHSSASPVPTGGGGEY